MTEYVNACFAKINSFIAQFTFFDLLFFMDKDPAFADKQKLPLVVGLLCVSAVFLTFRMGFVNIRFFTHAIGLIFHRSQKEGANSPVKQKRGDQSL